MPNHVENIVTFEGNEKDIKELMNCLVIEGEPSTEGFCPMPTELRGTTSPSKVKDQVLIKFYSGSVISDSSVYFQTAWATPYKAMVSLSEKFPSVTIKVQYADEDFGHNVGEYTLLSGDEIDINIPEGGSSEAIKMALEIREEYEWYLLDMWDDYEDDEIRDMLENDFYINVLKVAVDNKIFYEEISNIVKEKMIQLAVDVEAYRFAQKIKDSM
jgi:hypothetical protein